MKTTGGEITLIGTGGAGVDNLIGIFLDTTTLETTGAGKINLTGIGGDGTGNRNRGIFINNGSSLTTTGGEITLIGTGGAGFNQLIGILLNTNSTLETTGTGNINLTGTGGDGTGLFKNGIDILNSTLRANQGDINLTGTTGDISGDSWGIYIQNGILESPAGNITLTGEGSNIDSFVAGISLVADTKIDLTPGTGTLTLETNKIDSLDFSGGVEIKGNGPLILQPLRSPDDFEIDFNTFTGIQPGFSQITLGRTDSTGTLTLTGDTTFTSPLLIQAGTLNTTDSHITGTNQIPITLSANTGNIFTGTLTNPGGNITLTTGTDTAKIYLNNNLDTSDTTNPGGDLIISGNVILVPPTTTLSTISNLGSGNIQFNNTVNGTNPGTNNLTLSAGNGNITFVDTIGNTTPISNLILNTTGTTTLNSVTANSLLTNSGGTTQMGGNVTTTTTQTYNNNVILNNDITLTGTTLNFLGNVSSTDNSLTLNNSNILTFPSTTQISLGGNFRQTGSSAVNLGGNIQAANILFSQPVTLTNHANLTSNQGDIDFLNTLNGNFNLSLSAAGDITFTQGAGNLTPLDNVTITQTNNFLTNDTLNLASINHTGVGTVITQNILTNGGDVIFNADGEITLGNVTTSGGEIRPTSNTGAIITGDLNSSAATGGEIFVNARTRIATGNVNARGTSGAGGNITLDPIGDITVQGWIDSSGTTQGGSVTIISTGGSGVISTDWINANGGTQGGDISISPAAALSALPAPSPAPLTV